jgi:membrane protein YdbS with pleckstrin-like domain
MQAMDYIFYRTAKFFYKKDGASGHRAIILLSTFQSLVIIEIVLIMVFSFYTREEIYQFTSVAKFLGGAICILVFFLNFWKYKNKYKLFRDKWRNEEIKIKQKRGILIVVVLIIPWLVLILFGIR